MKPRTTQQRIRGRKGVKLRRRRLAAHPLCEGCAALGLVTAATVVDHIVPLALGGTDDDSNTRCLCADCHRDRTAEQFGYYQRQELDQDGWPTRERITTERTTRTTSHPTWFKPVHVPLTIVCGPPGSGKSTYVAQHAGPHDRIICFDQIAAALFGRGEQQRAVLDRARVMQVLQHRNTALGELMNVEAKNRWAAAWLIVGEPLAHLRAWWHSTVKPKEIIVLAVPAAECKRRIMIDADHGDRRIDADQWVDEWWKKYRPRNGDRLVKSLILLDKMAAGGGGKNRIGSEGTPGPKGTELNRTNLKGY